MEVTATERTNVAGRQLRPITDDQKAILVCIGFCFWFAAIFLCLAVLSAVHQAIRVEAGKGDSWLFAFTFIFLNPLAIAGSLCCALRLWHEFKECGK